MVQLVECTRSKYNILKRITLMFNKLQLFEKREPTSILIQQGE